MEYQLLSYPIDEKSPGFPGEPTVTITQCTNIHTGDVYNSYLIHLFNHFGTHFDAPNHFNPEGKKIADLDLSHFIYDCVLVIDLPKECRSLIQPNDLEPFLNQIKMADCLLIRTGLEKYRASLPKIYAEEGCAVSIQAAEYLIKNTPNLKAIGFDFISLASPAHPEHGVKAHQILLGMYSENYICIIEDMKLSKLDNRKIQKLFTMPLNVKSIDSSPVTVLATFDTEVYDEKD